MLVFVEAKKPSKAMVAHEKDLEWQELFDLALTTKMPDEEVVSMGYRVAGQCLSYPFLPLAVLSVSVYRGSCIEEKACGSRPRPAGLFQRCPRGNHRIGAREPLLRGTAYREDCTLLQRIVLTNVHLR